MRFLKYFLLSFGLIFVISESQASFILSPGVHYSKFERDYTSASSGTGTIGVVNYDLRLGHVFPMGLYLGGLYNSMDMDGGVGVNYTGYGASLGLIYRGFNAMFSYLISLSGDIDDSAALGGSTLEKGNGILFDVGYMFPLNPSFYVGPRLRYESVTVTEFKNSSGVSQSGDLNYTNLLPVVDIWFVF